MNTKSKFALIALVLASTACGGGGGTKQSKKVKDPSSHKDTAGNVVSKKAAMGFKEALDAFAAQEKSGAWAAAECKGVADKFIAASKEQRSAGGNELPEAVYNAGLSHQRCGDDTNAIAYFEQAVQVDRGFHRAQAQLALYKYKKNGNIDAAISELDSIIREAKYQNTEGLVALASLQMVRGAKTGGQGCNDDLACAHLNLQRALALDDSFMPAFNQLALYYLEQARGGAGRTKGTLVVSGQSGRKINKQRLDLAALVASQAQKKNPNYAPIHNTTGLILVELENYNGAVKAFKNATRLNPKFFEAQMNYAAVNLSFRGFGEAEKAYRAALSQRPDTYEAHLGLALSLRGAIDDTNFQKNVTEAQKHLDEAKKLEPSRPEAFYNEAILAQEYKAKRAGSDEATFAEFNKAIAQYQSFISKAQGKAGFEQAVKRSEARIQDMKDTMDFMKETKRLEAEDKAAQAEAKRMAEEAKKQEAEFKKQEEAAKKAEADAKKAEEAKKAEDAKKAEEAKKAPAAGATPAAKPAPAATPAPKK